MVNGALFPFFVEKEFRNKNIAIREEDLTIEKWDRITGIILFLIGVITAWSSVGLSMGSFRHPGSGFLPFGLSLILIILSLILIATRLGGRKKPEPFWPEHTWLRPFLGIIILFAYAAAIGKVGFLLTTLFFLLLWMGIIERLRWFKVGSISVVVTAALYIIFGKLLEVPLPVGFLKF